MALRQFLSFDAFPSGAIVTSSVAQFLPGAGVSDAYPGYGGMTVGSGAAPAGAAITSGWMRGQWYGYPLAGNGAGGCSCFGIPMSVISDGVSRATYIGFRWSRSAGLGGHGVMLSNNLSAFQAILPLGSTTYGQINFIEILIDRVNKLLTVWIDGAQYSSVFFDYVAYANGADTTLWFGSPYNSGYPSNYGTVAYWYMRDFYSLDDTQDSSLCSRLGPVDVRPAALAGVTAPNWISSDAGTPLADFTSPLTATSTTWTAPTQTEPPTMDPIQVQLANTGLVNGENILAVKADVSATRPGGYVFAPQASVKYNNQTAAGKTLAYPTGNAIVYNQNAFLMEKAPDGSIWSPSSLAAAVMTLTP